MNILLLFVSMLSIQKEKAPKTDRPDLRIYSACKDIDGERESYPYLSSLEPGCKYFFNKLAKKGEKFGRVIALCTKETLDGKSFSAEGTDISYKDISAYDVYLGRMKDFLRGKDADVNKAFAETIKAASPETNITPTPFCAPLAVFRGRARKLVQACQDIL